MNASLHGYIASQGPTEPQGFILPGISPIAIFGPRSLVFGLRSHLCCQACLATAIAADCRGSQNQRLMFPLWVNVRLMLLFGTNSQGFWSLVQKNGTKSVPQTVPERKGVPETTHSGTNSGDKKLFLQYHLLQQTFSTAESGPS